jgi:hypothetical protein
VIKRRPEPESFATVLMLYLLSSREGKGNVIGEVSAAYPCVWSPAGEFLVLGCGGVCKRMKRRALQSCVGDNFAAEEGAARRSRLEGAHIFAYCNIQVKFAAGYSDLVILCIVLLKGILSGAQEIFNGTGSCQGCVCIDSDV